MLHIQVAIVCFSTGSHPLTQLLQKYQYTTYARINPLLQQCAQYFPSLPDLESRTVLPPAGLEGQPVRVADTTPSSPPLSPRHAGTGDHHPPQPLKTEENISTPNSTSTRSAYNVQDFDDLFEETEAGKADQQKDGDAECSISDCAVSSPPDNGTSRASTSTSLSLDDMEKEALVRHFQNKARDVHEYLEKLQAMFIVAYEELDSAAGRDLCYSCLEEPFFKPVWPYVLALSR